MELFVNEIKDLILNAFFIFTFLFVFVNFIQNRKHSDIILFIVSSLLIIMCMVFPITLSGDHIFDMRQVPFIIGALYGGRKYAVALFVVLTVFRFYIGGVGAYGSFINNGLLLGVLWFVIPYFKNTEIVIRRVFLSFLASSFGLLFVFLSFILVYPFILYPVFLNEDFIFHSGFIIPLVILFIIQSLSILFFVSFIERERWNKHIQKEFNRIEKNNTVSEIAASISHEVRNPLTVTRGFLQLLNDATLTEDQKKNYIAHSIEELDRASTIITNYLTYAKPSSLQNHTLDVSKEITYIMNILKPFATIRNVEMVMKTSVNSCYVNGNAQQFQQCLINIIKNGIEAMQTGGEILIDMYCVERDVVINIQDMGNGMTDEQVRKLGTPYFSTKEEGTGLGVMVAFNIIKRLDGQIKVKSTVGEGTSFTIALPLAGHKGDKT
ncbi:HAMP domain-containing sensor histidine kinase [Alkalihalobacillus sp. LMS39]|uniref:sensor histidine kinase n=1 Tax=Alkalihalobacillus sp. LMS39 TaxID=2924032 RepID=UPI001FB53152|nr:HAMP domain-containing sensor histidine kinase [Alkalihalobacillus sp. LMS39]UOE92193.1 HAMP domain-containing histidine kinase [Alkalihalobacillus sp. LMS39]